MIDPEVASASDEVRRIWGVIFDDQAQRMSDERLQILYDVAFSEGMSAGAAQGYASGYSDGYETGVADGINATL
jgi:hypothetical protein